MHGKQAPRVLTHNSAGDIILAGNLRVDGSHLAAVLFGKRREKQKAEMKNSSSSVEAVEALLERPLTRKGNQNKHLQESVFSYA